jgi:hypothetical protein
MKTFLTLLLFLTAFSSIANGQDETTNKLDDSVRTEQKSDDSSKNNQVNQTTNYTRPDGKKRFKNYVNATVGPFALARTVAGAGISTWTNNPEEWGDCWEGFGRRVASDFGRNVIRQTVTFGLDEALQVDSGFYRSQNRSFKAKFRNAVISPFTARKPNGKKTIGIPRIVGTYTSSIAAAELWYPSRFRADLK